MTLITAVLIVVLIGLAIFLINRFVPMDTVFKNIITLVGIVVAVVVILKALGLWAGIASALGIHS